MDIGEIMKQAGAMQAKMQEMQEKLAELEVTGEAGGGMVKVILNGKGYAKPSPLSAPWSRRMTQKSWKT